MQREVAYPRPQVRIQRHLRRQALQAPMVIERQGVGSRTGGFGRGQVEIALHRHVRHGFNVIFHLACAQDLAEVGMRVQVNLLFVGKRQQGFPRLIRQSVQAVVRLRHRSGYPPQ